MRAVRLVGGLAVFIVSDAAGWGNMITIAGIGGGTAAATGMGEQVVHWLWHK